MRPKHCYLTSSIVRDKLVSRQRSSAKPVRDQRAVTSDDVNANNSLDGSFVISAIRPAPRHAGRFEVDANGRLLAILSIDVIERLGISVGVDITDRIEGIRAEAIRLAVYDRALNMLAFRARSANELSRALVQKGSDREHVNAAVARLVEQGYVDDAAFARAYARAKVVGANHSKRRVQLELQRKGVARNVADEAIGEVLVEEGVDQLALIEEAARRRLRTLGDLEPAVRRRRLYGFLARRGFDSSDIQAALRSLGDGVRADDAE